MPQIPEYQLFAEEMGPILWKELIEQGVKNPRVAFKNMITQLGYESQYGTTRLAKEQNNYGGVGYNDTTKKYSSYKDKADFAKQYVKLMNSKYKNAIGAKTLTDYAKAIRDIGYYTDTLENYANNLNGMKSFQRAIYNHVTNNPQLYSEGIKITKSGDGNKVMKIDPTEYANVPQYESTWSLRQPTNTIYPLNPADRAPESIDSWNGAQSPSKGPVMPSLQKQMDERQKMYDLFDEYAVSTGKKKLMPRLSDLLQKSKDNYIASILGINDVYDEPGYTVAPLLTPRRSFADGKDTNNLDFSEDIPTNFPDVVISGINRSGYSQDEKFNVAKDWLINTWLPGRKQYLQNRVDDVINEYVQNSAEYDPYNTDYGRMLQVISSNLGLKIPNIIDTQYKLNNLPQFANMDTFKQYLRNHIGWAIDTGINKIRNAKLINYSTAQKEDYPDFYSKGMADYKFSNPGLGAFVPLSSDDYVFGRGDNNISEFIHELNHIGQRHYTGLEYNEDNGYYKNPIERHSRMMQYRYENKINPDKFIYPSKEDLEEYHLNPSDDFNYIAENALTGYKNGKSPIHIKPANRGKLTRLKKRTGKSESELYNDGNPAHKKMVVFARNARKWKH